MSRSPLQIQVSDAERKQLQRLLAGGIQPVRTVLRALVLLQVAQGTSAPQIARMIPLTPQAIRVLLLHHDLKPWRETNVVRT